MGYGSVAYLRLSDDRNHVHCSFLMGKARLTPIKAVTIPRLELTAATVSVRLAQMLKKELDDEPDDIKYHTDSTTVLRYIGNDQRRFQVFVANRVQTIRDFSSPAQPSPADIRRHQRQPCRRHLQGNRRTDKIPEKAGNLLFTRTTHLTRAVLTPFIP